MTDKEIIKEAVREVLEEMLLVPSGYAPAQFAIPANKPAYRFVAKLTLFGVSIIPDPAPEPFGLPLVATERSTQGPETL